MELLLGIVLGCFGAVITTAVIILVLLVYGINKAIGKAVLKAETKVKE